MRKWTTDALIVFEIDQTRARQTQQIRYRVRIVCQTRVSRTVARLGPYFPNAPRCEMSMFRVSNVSPRPMVRATERTDDALTRDMKHLKHETYRQSAAHLKVLGDAPIGASIVRQPSVPRHPLRGKQRTAFASL